MRKQAQFRNHVLSCLREAEERFDVNFGRVTITFDAYQTHAGQAIVTSHPTLGRIYKLKFNKEAMSRYWDEMVTSTIPHEVAHLVCFAKPDLRSDGHDYKWRAIAIALGDSKRGAIRHTMALNGRLYDTTITI